ncbi:MAG TPA: hypothetical protein VFJ01_05600, partial [Oleiagrimonas sp.]|nr:hypothetical protein [Oleiagrimonas sp.]
MWLDFEPQLTDRLKAQLDASITVLAARDLAGVKEMMQITPAVQVYGGEYTPMESAHTGRVTVVDQLWTVVVVVRNAIDQKAATAARGDAGPICDAVLAALLGWPHTDPADRRLRLTRAPAPLWSPGG